jgi:hypothetical protein
MLVYIDTALAVKQKALGAGRGGRSRSSWSSYQLFFR